MSSPSKIPLAASRSASANTGTTIHAATPEKDAIANTDSLGYPATSDSQKDASRYEEGSSADEDELVELEPDEDQDYLDYTQRYLEKAEARAKADDAADLDIEPPAFESAEEILDTYAGAIDSMPAKVSKVSKTTRQVLNPRRCFVELAAHPDYLNHDLFLKVNRYEDTDGIDATELRDWPHPCAYEKWGKLPVEREEGCRVAPGDCFVYPGSTNNGPEREMGHERDAVLAPTRLLYVCGALALDLKSLVVWGARDPDKFKAHFLQVYGLNHPLAELSARDLLCAFVSTFEGVDIAYRRASRSNKAYNGWLDDYTGRLPLIDVVGANGNSGLGNTLKSFQAANRRWSKRANGWTGMIVAMAGTDPDLAAKAILAAQQANGYFYNTRIAWGGKDAPGDPNSDDRAHHGKTAILRFPRAFFGRTQVTLYLPPSALDKLEIGSMEVPSSALTLIKMSERSEEEQKQQLAFMGPLVSARVIGKWRFTAEINGTTSDLDWYRSREIGDILAEYLAIVERHYGALDTVAVPTIPGTIIDVSLLPSSCPTDMSRDMWIQSDTAYRGAQRRAASYSVRLDRWTTHLNWPDEQTVRLPPPSADLAEQLLDIVWLILPDKRVFYCYRARNDIRPVADNEWVLWKDAVDRVEPIFVAYNGVRRLLGLPEGARNYANAPIRPDDKTVEALIGYGVKSGKWACTALTEKINVPTAIRHIANKRDLYLRVSPTSVSVAFFDPLTGKSHPVVNVFEFGTAANNLLKKVRAVQARWKKEGREIGGGADGGTGGADGGAGGGGGGSSQGAGSAGERDDGAGPSTKKARLL